MNTSDDQNTGMKGRPFHKFFVFELKDLYWAENHLVDKLPEMIKAATSEQLKTAISDHLDQTRGHVSRLEQAFRLLEEAPKETKCKAMSGILKEAEDMINETADGSDVRDAAIIMAAQKVEHYEIASYGSVLAFSKLMGHTDVSKLLNETLKEEEQTNDGLNTLAESSVNEKAFNEKE